MPRKVISGKTQAQGITFTAQVWKEGNTYVAYAPELDISSCGETAPQAKSRLREAVTLFLEEAAHLGTLGEILAEAGFEKRGNTYRSHRVLAEETVRLPVPATS